MGRQFIKKEEGEEENVFWVTMSDMFLGLMMVFMILFVMAMTGYTQKKVKEQVTQSEVAQKLNESLKSEKIDATIDKVTGQVKISDLELFEVSSYELSPKGKQYLNKFIPIYVNTILAKPELADKITNIVIQGHTDSQSYRSISSKEGQFTKNMDLSLKRAAAVAEYTFKTGYNKKYTDKLIKTVIVEGKSYTDPVLVDGKEDYAKSRRVELKLIVKNSPDPKDFLLSTLMATSAKKAQKSNALEKIKPPEEAK